MNYFWFGDNLKDAVSKPRLHSQLFPNMVLVEPNFPKKYIKGLKRYGHKHITNDTTLFTGEQNLCFSKCNTNHLLTKSEVLRGKFQIETLPYCRTKW